jgi:hypothetical protein
VTSGGALKVFHTDDKVYGGEKASLVLPTKPAVPATRPTVQQKMSTASSGKVSPVSGKRSRSGSTLTTGILLILGIVAAIVLVLLGLAYGVYKYRSRDEGTYRIDEIKNYGYDACNSKPLVHLNSGKSRSSSGSSASSSRHKRKENREWYV